MQTRSARTSMAPTIETSDSRAATPYVPLADLQKRYCGDPGKAFRPESASKPPASLIQDRPRPRSGVNRRVGGVAALVRTFPSAPDDTGKPEHARSNCSNAHGPANTLGRRASEQEMADIEVHGRLLAGLTELQRLQTELDLTFRSVRRMPKSVLEMAAPSQMRSNDEAIFEHPDSSCLDLSSSEVRVVSDCSQEFEPDINQDKAAEDEILLQVELQGKTGGTCRGANRVGRRGYGLLFRSPWAWELHPSHEAFTKTQSQAWDARQRPWSQANADLPEKWSRVVGDNLHALAVDVNERTPELLRLRRVCPSPTVSKRSPTSVASSALSAVEARCARQERMLRPRLAAHIDEVTKLRQASTDHEAEEDEIPPGFRPLQTVQQSATELAADYLRELRVVLRRLVPALPSAARLVEAAVKGLVLALDSELSTVVQRAHTLDARVAELERSLAEAEKIKVHAEALEKEKKQVVQQLFETEQKHHEESVTLRKQVENLKQELTIMTPDHDWGTHGIAGVVADCAELLEDMERESGRQQTILRDMTTYTAGVLRGVGDEPGVARSAERGRVVELPNGEMLLRPCEVAEVATQVTFAERSALDRGPLDGQIHLRPKAVRELLNMFEGAETPMFGIPELEREIDRLYDAKLAADVEADKAWLPHSELTEFTVDAYLETLGALWPAQQRACGLWRSVLLAQRGVDPLPMKVATFARFLGLCERDQALPLPTLSTALQVRSEAALHLCDLEKVGDSSSNIGGARSLPLGCGGRQQASIAGEQHVPIPFAYEVIVQSLKNPDVSAFRALFASICRYVFIESLPSGCSRELWVLMSLLHERMQHAAAPAMRELVDSVDLGERVSVSQFGAALRSAKILGVDDGIWKKKLANTGPVAQPGQISGERLLEYLGPGAQARLGRGAISESGLLLAAAEVCFAGLNDRAQELLKLWQRCAGESKSQASFEDFRATVQSVEPSTPSLVLRSAYRLAVEASRACTQIDGTVCPVLGTLEPVSTARGIYGGDEIDDAALLLGVVQSQIFTKEPFREALERRLQEVQCPPRVPTPKGRGAGEMRAGGDHKLPGSRSPQHRHAGHGPGSSPRTTKR